MPNGISRVEAVTEALRLMQLLNAQVRFIFNEFDVHVYDAQSGLVFDRAINVYIPFLEWAI